MTRSELVYPLILLRVDIRNMFTLNRTALIELGSHAHRGPSHVTG